MNATGYGGTTSSHSHTESDVTGLTADLAGKASSTHDHTGTYSPTAHNHDSAYSASGHGHVQGDVTGLTGALAGKSDTTHNHDSTYSASGHDHTGTYSPTAHNHDSAYSASGHDHTGTYSPTTHNHDSAYSATGHNHDSAYAAAVHSHDGAWTAMLSLGTNVQAWATQAPQCRQTNDATMVELSGSFEVPTSNITVSAGSTIGTLPTTHRPLYDMKIAARSAGAGATGNTVTIATDGTITFGASLTSGTGSNTVRLPLDGIRFRRS